MAGNSIELDVEPGTHTLRAVALWSGSPELTFTIGAGERRAFVVGPSFLPVFLGLLTRDKYLYLENASHS